MVSRNHKVELGPGADVQLPLALSKYDRIQPAWHAAVVECNELRCEQMSSKCRRNCFCIVPALLAALALVAGAGVAGYLTGMFYLVFIGMVTAMIVMITVMCCVRCRNNEEVDTMLQTMEEQLVTCTWRVTRNCE